LIADPLPSSPLIAGARLRTPEHAVSLRFSPADPTLFV
jgi:hypothetical protein